MDDDNTPQSDDFDAAFIEIAKEMDRIKTSQNVHPKSKLTVIIEEIESIPLLISQKNVGSNIFTTSVFSEHQQEIRTTPIIPIQHIKPTPTIIVNNINTSHQSIERKHLLIIEEPLDALFEDSIEEIDSRSFTSEPLPLTLETTKDNSHKNAPKDRGVSQNEIINEKIQEYTLSSSNNKRVSYQNAIFKNYIKMLKR